MLPPPLGTAPQKSSRNFARLSRAGDRIVVTAGVPVFEAGTTNLLKVLEV